MKRYLLLLPLLVCGCSNDFSALEQYYVDSCTLKETNIEYVNEFADNFYDFTKGGKYNDDMYYFPIVNNIDDAKQYFNCGFTITIQSEWAGIDEYNY